MPLDNKTIIRSNKTGKGEGWREEIQPDSRLDPRHHRNRHEGARRQNPGNR